MKEKTVVSIRLSPSGTVRLSTSQVADVSPFQHIVA